MLSALLCPGHGFNLPRLPDCEHPHVRNRLGTGVPSSPKSKLSDQEGGGEERSEEGGQKEIEKERQDAKQDVLLAQRRKKVARV